MNKDFFKWLFLKPNKNSQMSNINICDDLFNHINEWIDSKDDITFRIPINNVLIYFYVFIYSHDNNINKNYNSEYDDLFNIKYHNEIVDIFIELKDKCNGHTVNYLNKRYITADNLMDFINNFTEISEEIILDNNERHVLDDEIIYSDYD